MSMIDFTTNIKKILKAWAANQLHIIWLSVGVREAGFMRPLTKGYFRGTPSLCFKARLRVKPFNIKMIFYPHVYETDFGT